MSGKFEDSFGEIFEELDDDFATVGFQTNSFDRHQHSPQPAAPRISSKKEETGTHACVDCGGTGKFRSWAGREVGPCFRCKGKGSFKTPLAVRQKAKFQREQRKEQERQSHLDDFSERFPDLLKELRAMESWNDFAKSLLENIEKWGSLTDKQLAAAQRMVDKQVARREQRAAERESKTVEVDGTRIKQMFADALAAGKKKRALHAAHLKRDENGQPVIDKDGRPVKESKSKIVMTPGANGRDAIWIKVDDVFCGGIIEGKFSPRREAPEWLTDVVKFLAANPEQETRLFGQATGTCCCCGLTLTNKDSIKAGIGPICAKKWGV